MALVASADAGDLLKPCKGADLPSVEQHKQVNDIR